MRTDVTINYWEKNKRNLWYKRNNNFCSFITILAKICMWNVHQRIFINMECQKYSFSFIIILIIYSLFLANCRRITLVASIISTDTEKGAGECSLFGYNVALTCVYSLHILLFYHPQHIFWLFHHLQSIYVFFKWQSFSTFFISTISIIDLFLLLNSWFTCL